MKVLAIGPSNHFITGQSKCFDFYVKNSKHKITVLPSTGKSYLYPVKYCFLVLYHFFFSNYDAIYFTSSRSTLGFMRDFLLLLVNYRSNCLIVNHLHGADFSSFLASSNSIMRFLIRSVYSRVDTSIVLSESMKDEYISFEAMDVKVIPNFFDALEVGNSALKSKVGEPINILFLSNLISSKGYKELISAIKYLNSANKNAFQLHIAGAFVNLNESEFNEFLTEDVIYHGVVQGESKKSILSDADVLVLPTYYPTEAQPLCVIEAMASGCYIITTNHNYMTDFVSDKNGAIIELDYSNLSETLIESLIKELKFIFDNKECLFKVMEKNIQYAKHNFSSDVYITRIDNIFRER